MITTEDTGGHGETQGKTAYDYEVSPASGGRESSASAQNALARQQARRTSKTCCAGGSQAALRRRHEKADLLHGFTSRIYFTDLLHYVFGFLGALLHSVADCLGAFLYAMPGVLGNGLSGVAGLVGGLFSGVPRFHCRFLGCVPGIFGRVLHVGSDLAVRECSQS